LSSNYAKTIGCVVAINSWKITLILQPARSDVKIGLVRAHGNRLNDYTFLGNFIVFKLLKVCWIIKWLHR